MRALMITKFVPFPDNSGGRGARSLAIARRLTEHFQLTLCTYSMDDTDATVLTSMGIDVRTVPWHPTASRVARGLARTGSMTGRFWTHELVTEVRRAASEGPLELLQVECLQMSPLARGLQARRRVLDLENVESSLVASYAQTRSGLGGTPYYVEARALRWLERRELPQYDVRVVVAEPELSRLPGPARTTLVCPNGREPTEILAPARSRTVAFVATMGWAPNPATRPYGSLTMSGPLSVAEYSMPSCCWWAEIRRVPFGHWPPRRSKSQVPFRTWAPTWPKPRWLLPPCAQEEAVDSRSSKRCRPGDRSSPLPSVPTASRTSSDKA